MPLTGQTPVEFWAGLVLAKLAPLRDRRVLKTAASAALSGVVVLR